MEEVVELILAGVGLYLAAGVVFAGPFLLLGAGRIDPDAAGGSWGFRLLVLPGVVVLWPLLLRSWLRGGPATESNPHREAASGGGER